MRVLLVSANQERSPDPVAPLGVCYVATAAAEAGHEVHVIDLCFSEDPPADVRVAVAAHRPEAIGISLRNVDNCAYPDTVSYLPHYRAVVEACRAASDAPIVLGGSAFTTMPAHYLAALHVPYGVVGEGEVAFPALLARLAVGESPRGLAGIALWDAATGAVEVAPPPGFRPWMRCAQTGAGSTTGATSSRAGWGTSRPSAAATTSAPSALIP